MIILNKDKYNQITDRLKKIPFNTLFAKAVLDHKVDGKVFVDNIHSPKTFLISHAYGMSLLFGDENNSKFNNDLFKYIFNKDKIRKKTEWLQVYPEVWNNKLHELINNHLIIYNDLLKKYNINERDEYIAKNKNNNIIQWNRINFSLNSRKRIEIENNYELIIINPDNYDLIQGSVIPRYFWKSKDDFLSNGIGYLIIHNNEFVSTAFSAFIDEKYLEIGVETSEKYRNRGISKSVCKALMNYCIANKFIPVWACRKENFGSYKLGISLGFEENCIIPYYELIV